MSAARCHAIKAAAFIAFLVVSEARGVHRHGYSNSRPSLRSDAEENPATTDKPLKALASFLRSVDPATAFALPSPGTRAPRHRLSLARPCPDSSDRQTGCGCRTPLHRTTTRLSGRANHPRMDDSPAVLEADTQKQDAEPLSQDEISEALQQTAKTVALSFAFCFGIYAMRGLDDASSWLAAYVLEESLSVDNLFVFSLIFNYFQTPNSAQPRVLRWGLIAAAVLRLSFILAGLAAVERFKGVMLLFSGILLYSAFGLLTGDEEEEEDLSDNFVVKLTKKYLPSTDQYDGDKFFTDEGLATPLLLALVCVEISDVIFAADSIPAVFGVTQDPFIAFTSNAFAILGLRALYTVVANAVDQFEYLPPAIAIVLGFIGVKLTGCYFDFEVPTTSSLLFVLGSLGTGIGLSILPDFKEESSSQSDE